MSDLEREARTNWVDYLVRAQIGRVLAATPTAWRQFVVEHYPPQPPGLDKTPLTLNRRSGAEDLPYANSHGVHDPAFAQETVVLLHFKFTSDLRDKVDAELLRQEHFRYGAEYMMYHKLIQDRRNLDLFKPGLTERFTSSDVFDRLGFFSITRQLQGQATATSISSPSAGDSPSVRLEKKRSARSKDETCRTSRKPASRASAVI
jgi:hypothetical protein